MAGVQALSTVSHRANPHGCMRALQPTKYHTVHVSNVSNAAPSTSDSKNNHRHSMLTDLEQADGVRLVVADSLPPVEILQGRTLGHDCIDVAASACSADIAGGCAQDCVPEAMVSDDLTSTTKRRLVCDVCL